ncbi:MAG: hypothetical protein HYS13_25015 [Planctomycetia bacterium]|nr:hypothetical protein [Planctomycetia bacterium]
MRLRFLAVAVLATAVAATSAASKSARGKEPVEAFLDALRTRQMHEEAEMYLDALATNPNLPSDLKERLPFEQGKTLVAKVTTMTDVDSAMKELDRATAKYNEFLNASPNHPLAGTTKLELGVVLRARGDQYLRNAKRPGADKASLRQKARELFKQAEGIFDKAGAEFEAAWKAITPEAQNDKAKALLRDQYRTDTLTAWIQSAESTHDLAQTHEPGSKEHKETLQAAANKFHTIYEKARRRMGGVLAGMKEGRCYQEMGELKRALGIFDEMLAMADDFRELKPTILRYTLEAWSDPAQAKHEEAAKRGTEWLDVANAVEADSPDGLAVRYYTAWHQHLWFERDKAKPEFKNQVDPFKRQIVAHLRFVADRVGEFQRPAKELLAKYRPNYDPNQVNTFADAREFGKTNLDIYQQKAVEIELEQAKGANADPKVLSTLEKERLDAMEAAIKFYSLALVKAPAEEEPPPMDEVNTIRYLLAFLYYQLERPYESAVIAEFVAEHYPQSPQAKDCANIAMAAYSQGYYDSRADERQFDTEQMGRVATLITKNWPNDELSHTAWLTLGQIAIDEDNLEKAKECLDKIPADSKQRGDADLKAGHAIWKRYLTSLRQDPPPDAALQDALRKEAESKLRAGVTSKRKELGQGEPTLALLARELDLAAILVKDRAPEALQILSAPNGCLDLVKKNHPVTQENPLFPRETYKAALLAYVAVQNIEQAESMMQELEKLAQGPDADKQLVQMYIQLGRDLEDQVRGEKDPAKKEVLTKGFEVFLKQIMAKSDTLNTLAWVGEVFFSLGSSQGGTSRGKQLMGQAAATYERILKHKDLKPENQLFYNLRLATARRQTGEFKAAAEILYAILSLEKHNKVLDAQREAATTYQEWGDAEKNPFYYQTAIAGYHDKNLKRKVLWGWAEISVRLQRDKDRRDVFHEARINIADCRLKWALCPQSATGKADLLKKAANDIAVVHRFDNALGGATWRPKYDRLMQDIQRAAGQPPAGVRVLDEEAARKKAAAASTANK